MRKATQDKAITLVGEGKVEIQRQTDDILVAVVVGESGTYDVLIDPAGAWCTCAHGQYRSPHANCSHVLAAMIESVRGNG